jgi:hypothetical protein
VWKEPPDSGAQLRFTDADGRRFTAFAADAKRGQLAARELRHRRRARCEDRIRSAKHIGLVLVSCWRPGGEPGVNADPAWTYGGIAKA